MSQLKFSRRNLVLIFFLLAGLVAPLAGASVSQAALTSIYGLGANNYGQFGTGTVDNNYHFTPVSINLPNLTKIVAHYDNAFGVTNDGRLLGWGTNNYGQLGLGTSDSDAHPTPAYVVGPTSTEPYLTDVSDVAIGSLNAYALKKDGTVWAWGNNGYGQLGQGNTSNLSLLPVQVGGLTGIKIVAISASFSSGFALAEDGTVYGWGYNRDGMLGVGDYNIHYTATKLSFHQPAGSTQPVKIKSILSGDNFSLAIDLNNNLWAWGVNTNGQLGDGTINSSPTPKLVLANVASASAGDNFTLAATLDGKVYAWGNDTYFQLGDNSSTRADQTTPQLISGLSGVKQVVAGGAFGLALTSDNSIYGWGNSLWGQVGPHADPYDYILHVPTKITSITGATNIVAGRTFSLFFNGQSGPVYNIDQTVLNFGPQDLGTNSVPQTITIQNTGNVDLTFTDFAINGNLNDFLVSFPGLPYSVAPGGVFRFSITFQPLAIGPRTATVVLTANDPASPHTITLNGTGAGHPKLEVSPLTLDFGSLAGGQKSAPQNITLKNSGLTDALVTLTPNQGTCDNLFNVQPFSKRVLPAGQTMLVPVTFEPTLGYPARSCEQPLSISEDSEGISRFTVKLTGTVLASGKHLSFSPNLVDFGNQLVNAPVAKTVTITNDGTLPITVTKLDAGQMAGHFEFALTPASALPVTLQPGQNLAVKIAFTAKDAISYEQTLVVFDETNASQGGVVVRGAGVAQGQISFNPANLDFNRLPLNTTSPAKTVKITNSGKYTVVINGMETTDGHFSVSGLTSPATLAPGQSVSVNVTFKTDAPGDFKGYLVVHGTNGIEGSKIPLHGSSVNGTISISPSSLAFPSPIQVGQYETRQFKITSTSNVPVTISKVKVVYYGTKVGEFVTYHLDLPTTIPAGQSRYVDVQYHYQNVGLQTATLILYGPNDQELGRVQLMGNLNRITA